MVSRAGIDAGAADGVVDRRHDVRRDQLLDRDVDRQTERARVRGRCRTTSGACGARLVEHPRADLDDESGVLGERNELRGTHQSRAPGWRQRISASTPTVISSESRTIGW